MINRSKRTSTTTYWGSLKQPDNQKLVNTTNNANSRYFFFNPSASTTLSSTFAGLPSSFHTAPKPPR
jgi:hypothetical protein